jgi:hypothetical protein
MLKFGSAAGLLVGSFVIAGVAAGVAVHESVLADSDIEHGLAEAAVLIALALRFRHFTLGATVFGLAGSGGHKNNVALDRRGGERAGSNIDCRLSILGCRLKILTALLRRGWSPNLIINQQFFSVHASAI